MVSNKEIVTSVTSTTDLDARAMCSTRWKNGAPTHNISLSFIVVEWRACGTQDKWRLLPNQANPTDASPAQRDNCLFTAVRTDEHSAQI